MQSLDTVSKLIDSGVNLSLFITGISVASYVIFKYIIPLVKGTGSKEQSSDNHACPQHPDLMLMMGKLEAKLDGVVENVRSLSESVTRLTDDIFERLRTVEGKVQVHEKEIDRLSKEVEKLRK